MGIGLKFLLVAILLVALAAVKGGAWWGLIWPALSFAIVALGYLGVGFRVFGKQQDGTIAWLAIVALLPFFLLAWTSWHLMRLRPNRPKFHRLLPNILIGRRLLPSEVPDEIQMIVDLTAEFLEGSAVRQGRRYLCVPMLDLDVGDQDAFVTAAREIATANCTVYIHCAQGFGRTGTMAAAVLIAKGLQPSVDGAVAEAKSARPGVRLSAAQFRLLRKVCSTLCNNHPDNP